jgi:hypothetical protein
LRKASLPLGETPSKTPTVQGFGAIFSFS